MTTISRLQELAAERLGKADTFRLSREWNTTEWLLALFGEVGEAANVQKKINRGDYAGEPDIGRLRLADELADVLTYLALAAESAGIDLQEAITTKFNLVSARVGVDIFMGPNNR